MYMCFKIVFVNLGKRRTIYIVLPILNMSNIHCNYFVDLNFIFLFRWGKIASHNLSRNCKEHDWSQDNNHICKTMIDIPYKLTCCCISWTKLLIDTLSIREANPSGTAIVFSLEDLFSPTMLDLSFK